jgi:hypothetical protein
MTDLIAQTPYTMASAPQPMMAHKAVMNSTRVLKGRPERDRKAARESAHSPVKGARNLPKTPS